MTTEDAEKLRIARIAAKMSLQVIGEDPETALAILLTALQLVGKTCGIDWEDGIFLAREAFDAVKVEQPEARPVEGMLLS